MACGQLRVENDQDEAQQADIDEALAAFGLVAVDPVVAAEETFVLWPENVAAFNFWRAVQTQWRRDGMGYPGGLDYAGVRTCMALRGVRKKDRAELFEGVQAMEQATLTAWDKQKK